MGRFSSDVAVVGAGPYGLSAAALLRHRGVEVHVFGRAMSFWREHMPRGMLLRSSWDASHIGAPHGPLSLTAFETAIGAYLRRPIPVEDFVTYGEWFRDHAVTGIDERELTSIAPVDGGFVLRTPDGEELACRRVVVAAGIAPFAYLPPELRGIDPALVTHSSHHADLARFRGEHVAVVGGGTSAVETAVLLADAGADVEMLVRGQGIRWISGKGWLKSHAGVMRPLLLPRTDVGPIGLSFLVAHPGVTARLPRGVRARVERRSIRPAASHWLRSRFERVRLTTGAPVRSARATGNAVELRLGDGSARVVDHVIGATGFRVDIAAYRFIQPDVAARIVTVGGYPTVNGSFETSIPGLHVIGAPSAFTFGPLMRFVAGTEFTADRLAHRFVPVGREAGMSQARVQPDRGAVGR